MSPPANFAADAPGSGLGVWEEPHPGRRLCYPPDAAARAASSAVGAHPGGICGGDMAAKGSRQKHDYRVHPRQWLVRRQVRVRVRNSLLRTLTIPKDGGQAEPVLRSVAVGSTHQHSLSDTYPPPVSAADPIGNTAAGGSAAAEAGRADMETETDCGSSVTEVASRMSTSDVAEDASTIRGPLSPVVVSPGLHFSDFSNHLGIHLEPDFDDDGGSVVTAVDPECLSRVTAGDDTYGWEAELSRKISGEALPAQHGPCCCTRCQYRRASGYRRGLLHRVFNLSHASKQAAAAAQPRDTNGEDSPPEERMTL